MELCATAGTIKRDCASYPKFADLRGAVRLAPELRPSPALHPLEMMTPLAFAVTLRQPHREPTGTSGGQAIEGSDRLPSTIQRATPRIIPIGQRQKSC
jgi:hypothetical protein